MNQNGQQLSPFRGGVRAFLIGALIAITLTVLLSWGVPLLPLTFAFRFTLVVGGIGAYFGYRNAVIHQRMREPERPADEPTPGTGWRTTGLLGLVIITGSFLLVCVTAAIFKLITGGEKENQRIEQRASPDQDRVPSVQP